MSDHVSGTCEVCGQPKTDDRPGCKRCRRVTVTRNADGTVTLAAWPPPGVVAVAELLRAWYRSEYDTDAPIGNWYADAAALVKAYLEATDDTA